MWQDEIEMNADDIAQASRRRSLCSWIMEILKRLLSHIEEEGYSCADDEVNMLLIRL